MLPLNVFRCHSLCLNLRQSVRWLSSRPTPMFSPAPFNSLRLDLRQPTPLTPNLVSKELEGNLEQWRASGVNTVWVHLRAPEHGTLLTTLTGPPFNFDIHHGKGKDVTLCRWLPSTPSKVPTYGGTQIGVGGIAVDEQGRFLLIRERTGSVFKFPGGLSEPGEGFDECVKREVYEETGVRTQFEGVIGLRHMHGLAFGVSDVYCITLLRPLTHTITIDPGEIAEGVWSDGEAFVASTTHPLMKIAGRKALAVARQRGWIKGSGGGGGDDDVMDRHHVYSTISKKWTSIYLTGSPPEEEFLQALKHVPQGIPPPVERVPWEGEGGRGTERERECVSERVSESE